MIAKIEPLIVVSDVKVSSRFYQYLLQCSSGHGGDEYEMIMAGDKLILQLHNHDTHHHPGMCNHDLPLGNGMVLWFRTDDFKGAVERVRELKAEIVAEPHVNPNARQHEIWFKDPDGYLIVISDNMWDADKV